MLKPLAMPWLKALKKLLTLLKALLKMLLKQLKKQLKKLPSNRSLLAS